MTLTRYARGYEIVHYGEDANEHLNGVTQIRRFNTDGGAKAFAGRLSKRIKGPVDVAHAGAADWGNRYMTTASPSPYHASGYRFERLD